MKFPLRALLLSLVCSASAVAQSTAPVLERSIDLNLPGQVLADSIVALSRQAGAQILMPADLGREHAAPPLVGTMTLGAALDRLLAGSGLTYRPLGSNSVGIVAARSESAATGDELAALLGFDGDIEPTADAVESGGPTDTIVLPVADAQPVASPPPPPSRRAIEEIIVTATKREKSLRDVPASIAALDGEQLVDSGAEGMADYLEQIPGVAMNQGGLGGGDSSRMTVRGMGLDTVSAVSSNPTGIFIGETPYNDPFLAFVMPDLNPFDLAGVELLKGPQGTLFGGSALAGALRYKVNKPDPSGFGGRFSLSGSSVDEGGEIGHTAAVALNIPAGDTLAFRLVGLDRFAPGYVDETGRGEQDINHLDQRGWRVLADWQPLDELRLEAIHLVQESEAYDLGFADNREGRFERSKTPEPNFFNSGFSLSNLTGTWAFDWADLVLSTSQVTKELRSYLSLERIYTNTSSPTEALFTTFDLDAHGTMQEVRLVSTGTGRWEWLVGAFTQDYTLDFKQPILAGTRDDPIPIIPDNTIELPTTVVVNPAHIQATATEVAAFADVTRAIGQSLEITLGLRNYRIRVQGTSEGYQQSAQADISEDGINPKLALTWQLRDNLQVYGLAAKGFRYGGIQIGPPAPVVDDQVPRTYGSDTVWNYELALRTDWLDRTLQADLTVFRIDWDNAQFSQPAPSGTFFYIDNIAAAKTEGAELTVQWLPPVEGLTISAAAAYIDARTAAPFNDSAGNEIPPGTRMPGSSRFSSSLSTTYSRTFGPWALDARFSHAYQGEGFNDLLGSHRILGFSSMDFGIGVKNIRLRLLPELRLNINNLTNEAGINNIFSDLSWFDVYYYAPRTLRLTMSWRF